MSIPDEDYPRSVSWGLNLISTFLYDCQWNIIMQQISISNPWNLIKSEEYAHFIIRSIRLDLLQVYILIITSLIYVAIWTLKSYWPPIFINNKEDCHGRNRMVVGFTTICATKVVSSNLTHGEVCSIQHYVIKFVSDLRQVDGFLRVRQQKNWPQRYNWNIVESWAKHHKPNPNPTAYLYLLHLKKRLIASLVIHDQIFKWKIVSTRFVFHNNIGWLWQAWKTW